MTPADTITIVTFNYTYQPGVDLLFQSIRQEFSEEMFTDPEMTLTYLSSLAGRKYWVAFSGEQLIGTVGILILGNHACCLKSMFLAKEFRGDSGGAAKQLLQTALSYAKQAGCKSICLGTMAQFSGAQRFYEKNGFILSDIADLPPDFPANSVDTVFYKKDL